MHTDKRGQAAIRLVNQGLRSTDGRPPPQDRSMWYVMEYLDWVEIRCGYLWDGYRYAKPVPNKFSGK